MTKSPEENPISQPLVVPKAIEDAISGFNSRADIYSTMDVHSAVCSARQTLQSPTPAENTGAWAEVLAFGLAGTEHNEKPWGTYFGPMGSGTQEGGEIVYFPDVRQADAAILEHWKSRSKSRNAPVLTARYCDLVWDLSNLIANESPSVGFARSAIDAYLLTARQDGRKAYCAFPDAERALALAIQIGDRPRRDAARAALLALHKMAVAEDKMWWKAYDALEDQPKSGLLDAERMVLITDLEGVLARVADASDPGKFDPHHVEGVANRLITHYRRTGQNPEVRRLHLEVAKAFEHFGKMGDAMLASLVLQTSMDAYRQAGMNADAERILRLIERSNLDSIAQMTRHEHVEEIPKEVIEEFLQQVVADTKEETFHRLAGEFLTIRLKMEEQLEEAAKTSPLATFIPRSKIQGNRVVANIGSLADDPIGHLIEQSSTYIGINGFWLRWAFDRTRKRHTITDDDIVKWANRTGLFGDDKLLREGVGAWLADDYIKATHILIPQVEAAFRTLVGRLGRPTTKPHPQMRQARMVITMGEILCQEETVLALGKHGPDIALHFRALYADPRGHNLRNDIAHGLLAPDSINQGTMLWIIHSLLLLGAWLKPEDGGPTEEPRD